jgi:hypothetical protein
VLVRLGQEVQEVPRGLAAALAITAITAIGAVGIPVAPAAPKQRSVTISGRAYAFNHSDVGLGGAVIRVRELPGISAIADVQGDYEIEVPDDTNVTPYIEPPAGYHQIDLQTFHTRGRPIENANFQTPADAEYNGLAALLQVPLGADGRPEQCVIVTTASARNVRGVDFETFQARTPHGVAGATARTYPFVMRPIYFNDQVIPDRSRSVTSGDGGVIWVGMPAGVYRVEATSPENGFATFLATCEPGRIINANPPWGLYELSPGERPLGAGLVAGSVNGLKVTNRDGRRRIVARVKAAESLRLKLSIRQDGQRFGVRRPAHVGPGHSPRAIFRVPDDLVAGRARLKLRLIQVVGGQVIYRRGIRLPAADANTP